MLKRQIDTNIDNKYTTGAYLTLDFTPQLTMIYSVKVIIYGDMNIRQKAKTIDVIKLTTYVEKRNHSFFLRIARRTKLSKIDYLSLFYLRESGNMLE